MRTSKHFLIGSLSVMGLFVGSLSFSPLANVLSANSWAGDTATARGVIAKSSVGGRVDRDKCAVPPTWGDMIQGKNRWVKKWGGLAYCDRMTGLVWGGSPSSTAMTWGGAQLYCLNRTLEGDKGKKGWRLPSAQELASLVDTASSSCQDGEGCLPDGHPFTNVQLSPYWTASTFPGDPTQAWFVGFDIGNVDCCLSTDPIQNIILPAWCLRGASYADVY